MLPGEPTEVLGLTGTPEAGDEFSVVEDETRARDITAFRAAQARSAIAATTGRSSLEQMFDKIKVGEAKTLPIIVKGDVRGSVEAIQQGRLKDAKSMCEPEAMPAVESIARRC